MFYAFCSRWFLGPFGSIPLCSILYTFQHPFYRQQTQSSLGIEIQTLKSSVSISKCKRSRGRNHSLVSRLDSQGQFWRLLATPREHSCWLRIYSPSLGNKKLYVLNNNNIYKFGDLPAFIHTTQKIPRFFFASLLSWEHYYIAAPRRSNACPFPWLYTAHAWHEIQ